MRYAWPIMSIGDNHLPFFNQPAFDFILRLIKQIKPKIIIDLGDKYDFCSFGKFPKRMRLSPYEEVELGLNMAWKNWHKIRKAAGPKCKCFQIMGNHDERPSKRLIEKLPELDAVYELKDLWSFPGVETIKDPRDDLIINDIQFTHGHRSKIGDHLKNNNFKNVNVGHLHRGGVYFHRLDTGEIKWELNSGFIGDPFSPELIYRPMKKYFTWTAGVGLIDESGPRFIPFNGKEKR